MTHRRKDRPIQYTCLRCGAPAGDRCRPVVDTARYPTIVGYHSERGATPGALADRGYKPYGATDPGGLAIELWRRSDQQVLRREGWTVTVDSGPS